EQILQVVMDMGRFVARGLAGHLMAVDDEGQVAAPVPGMEGKPGDAGFLDRFALSGEMKGSGRLVMAARLQPAADGDVIDEQGLAVIGRKDHRTGGEVPWKSGAPVEPMALIHLPAQ